MTPIPHENMRWLVHQIIVKELSLIKTERTLSAQDIVLSTRPDIDDDIALRHHLLAYVQEPAQKALQAGSCIM